MAKRTGGIALGIGRQTDQVTINPNVRDATELVTTEIPTSPTADEATGILLRSDEDISISMTREETDGGRTPGSLTRETGTLIRTVPAVSFTIDLQGNHLATGTPDVDDFTQEEYLERLFAGARLERGTATTSETPYLFAADDSEVYHTLKIWSGLDDTESWTLGGCSFNLAFTHTPGEVSRIEVTVFADTVIYKPLASETFPPNVHPDTQDLATAYGTQTQSAPICENAASTFDGVVRGFQTATLSIEYDNLETLDSNVEGGKLNSQSTRNVLFAALYFADDSDAAGDFPRLEDNMDVAEASNPTVTFLIGVAAGAGVEQNAFKFTIPALRVEVNDEDLSGEKVKRNVSGYAVRQGTSGLGFQANRELLVEGI